MNIFVREIRANLKPLIIWCVCMFLTVLSGMSKYTAYSSSKSSSDVFNKMPRALKELFGMGSLDVSTMSGFFGFLVTYLVLIAAIHAVLLGNGIIAKEERDKTTEFIIAKPVSRFTIITGKFLAALTNVIILNIVTLFSSIASVSAFNKGRDITTEIIIFDLSILFVQLIFLALGAFLAAFRKRSKTSGSIAVSILLGSYIIAKITGLVDNLDALNVLSPFKYFSYTRIVNGDGLNPVIILMSLLLAVSFVIATYHFYMKRDLNI